jgi:hypothetical protein
MAKDKKSFVAYCDWLESFEELTDEEAGRLAKHLFRYVNDLNPEAPDKITKMCFIPIKQSLKRDLVKYEERAERARENGAKGGRPKTQKTQSVISEPKKPDSVNVSVNDNVNVNANVNGSVSNTPTREEVEKEICNNLFTRGIASVSFPVEDLAQRFHDNYESKGWEINGQRIHKWQPKLNQWISEELKNKSSSLETQEEKEAREFMQMINDYNTHKTLYGEDSANAKFNFDVQPDNNNYRIA